MKYLMKETLLTIMIILFCLIGITGCDAFRSWFDKTATTTVIDSRQSANLAKLKADLRTIQRSVQVFNAQNGRYPDSLDELARKGAIARIPREPFGGEWLYDQYSGGVKSSTHPDIVLD
ncbi:hypothetical protein JW823_06985 [bacterium]|nr:hypothetical protein [candidate division CSSED10-310 bacterium]